jgi:histidine triad (HIT) family protein
MELSQEELEEFKRQIIQQINSNFSEDKKTPAIERIKSMNDEEFIDFLKKNKLLPSETDKEDDEELERKPQQGNPFRLIVDGKISSYLIDENKSCLAVLEINPISKAHIIIIPKNPVNKSENISKEILSLAKKLSKKIETKLKPKEVLTIPSSVLGETILNILPVYSNENISSPRKQVSKEELENLKNLLGKKQKVRTEKKPKIKKIEESKLWLPRRIP